MDHLEALLAEWLPRQRWFAGKSRAVEELRVVGRREIPGGLHLMIGVRQSGSWRVYQVPVLTDGPLRDALDSTEAVRSLLRDADWTDRRPEAATTRMLGVEQSNTSVVVDEAVLAKFFRMVRPGGNADVDVHEGLRALGSTDVAEIRGRVRGHWIDPGSGQDAEGDLAMVQRFYSDAVGGWELARSGTDMTGLLAELGATTARVHRDLSRAFGTARVDAARIADRIRTRLDAAAGEVPELRAMHRALLARLSGLSAAGVVDVQRIHGDLHLSQALRTGGRWLIVDFEGEPGAQGEAGLDHPLRDVAGMLRSFDYMAAFAPREAPRWRHEYADAFVSGYVLAGGEDPAHGEGLLDAYVLDKAVYEVVYESRNRPEWLPIPLAAIRSLAGK